MNKLLQVVSTAHHSQDYGGITTHCEIELIYCSATTAGAAREFSGVKLCLSLSEITVVVYDQEIPAVHNSIVKPTRADTKVRLIA